MTFRSSAIFCLLLASTAAAQPTARALPGDAAIDAFLRQRVTALANRPLASARNLEQWQQQLPQLRQEYFDMLGLWPLPEKTPLNATITGTVDRGEVLIDKLHFQSRPGLYVTGNLYRPRQGGQKRPAILYLCGHSARGRDGNKTAFQDHGMWFARNGYIALLIDTLQLGELAGKHHGTYNLGRFWWHSAGYTPAGVECWNGVRAIDYLVSRDDVDADRLGVTGISGGGAATVWISAADPRVKVAVPVSGMSDLESYVSNKVINGHCDCMFLYNSHAWDWATIAALIAPRPMLFANSDNDPIFPMDGNRRIMARLQQAYTLHGKPDLVAEYVSKGGHDYRPDLRVAIFQWFHKHLAQKKEPVQDVQDSPLPGKQLRVFAEDADLPRDARNGRIDEDFVPTAAVRCPTAGEFASWRNKMLAQLRSGPFRWLGEELNLPGQPLVATPESRTLLVEDGSEETSAEWEKLGPLTRLVPRGLGATAWTRRSPPNTVERAHALVGLTVDLGRVQDILKGLKEVSASREQPWRLAGRGQAGVLASYAALFAPEATVREVVVVDPPASHRAGPHFLGVLRVLDIPEALGLLAPLPLTLISDNPAFERTARLYAAAGAADRLNWKRSAAARIDPVGVEGRLLLSGDNPTPGVLDRFVELAGLQKAQVVVLTGKKEPAMLAALQAALKKQQAGPAQVLTGLDGPQNTEALQQASGVWLASEVAPMARDTLQAVLQRQGVVAGSGAGLRTLEKLIPGAVLEAADVGELSRRLGARPGSFGLALQSGMAVQLSGRIFRAVGEGSATVLLAAGAGRPAREMPVKGRQQADLTTLRQAARNRAAGYPAHPVADPVVPGKGTLVIVGGGGMPPGLIQKFVDLAGGKAAHIVVLPTALPDPLPARDGIANAFRKLGAKVTELRGRTRAEVESPASLAALRQATGIWFGGGRQWRFIDAYEDTQTVPLMFEVLRRGGVIGGSSAGATIQGEYLCRGGFFDNFNIIEEGYERGLGFLPGTAIDQHFAQRKRFKDMTGLMKAFPAFLGIGIDEATALIVRGSEAEVVGKGSVHIYDARRPIEAGKPDHESVSASGRYDLKSRRLLPAGKEG